MNDSLPAAVMSTSALILGVAGLGLLFAPIEGSAFVVGASTTEAAGQLISAGFLAVAILNWTGRGAVYGGIYGRPIILANFLFGFILVTTTLRSAFESGGATWMFAVYGALHTAVFAWMLFGHRPIAAAAHETGPALDPEDLDAGPESESPSTKRGRIRG